MENLFPSIYINLSSRTTEIKQTLIYLSGLRQDLHVSSADLLPVRLLSPSTGTPLVAAPAAVVLEHGQYAKRLARLNRRLHVLRLHGNHWEVGVEFSKRPPLNRPFKATYTHLR